MKSGYKLHWSDQSVTDLKNIIEYLEYKWTDKEVRNFVKRLNKRLELIAINPKLFPKTLKRKNIRRSVLTKQTVIYYETSDASVRIVALYDTRRDPKKITL